MSLDAEKVAAGPYDKHGREIMIGDLVKVFHFIGARRKRHYMYKHVTRERRWDSGFVAYFFSHLSTKPGDGYYEARDGRQLEHVEIVQSADAAFEDRPRLATADAGDAAGGAGGWLANP